MRRLTPLVALAFACDHRARGPAAPTIDVGGAGAHPIAVVLASDVEGVPARMPVDLAQAPGCFAWSPAKRAVACIVGEWSTVSMGEGEPGLVFLDAGDREEVPVAFGDRFELDAASREVLDARLARDGFIELPPSKKLPANGADTIAGFTLRTSRAQVYEGGDNSAPRYDVSLTVDHRGHDGPVVQNAWSAVACAEPLAEARDIGGGGLLVEHRCHIADEGQYAIYAEAWVCTVGDCR